MRDYSSEEELEARMEEETDITKNLSEEDIEKAYAEADSGNMHMGEAEKVDEAELFDDDEEEDLTITPIRKNKHKAKNDNTGTEAIIHGFEDAVSAAAEENAAKDTSKNVDKEPESDHSEERKPNRITPSEMAEYLMESELVVNMQGMLRMYNPANGVWELISDKEPHDDLRRILPYEFRKYIDKYKLNEVYSWLKTDAVELTPYDLMKRKDYINLTDCALHIDTEETVFDRKDLYFTYDPKVTREEFLQARIKGSLYKSFLDRTFGDDKKSKMAFEEVLGLALSYQHDVKIAPFFYGAPNSGKTQILKTLYEIVGPENVGALSFSQLGEEFSVANLAGKHINITPETKGVSNKRIDIFKSITGGDPIMASFKGKDHFTFVNQALLMFAANSFPEVSPEDIESFVARICFIHFKHSVPRDEWIDNLYIKLLDEAPVIIKSALEGLQRLRKHNFIVTESKSSRECKRNFIGEFNSFLLFADDHIRLKPGNQVSSKRIKSFYTYYCQTQGLIRLADNSWSKTLQQKFPVRKINITSGDELNYVNYNSRGYEGIELVNMADIKMDEKENSYSV